MFTYELESNNILPIRNNDKLEFEVCRKLISKNDHIHFYSHYNTNTKRRVIIGFYLRPFCICSLKYLNDKFNHIENSFLDFLYSKPFIHFVRFKALKIHDRNRPRTIVNTLSNKIRLLHTHIILPNNSSPNIIGNNLINLTLKL